MDLRVPFDQALETQLREHAAAAGKDVVTFVVEAVREKLESEPLSSNGSAPLSLDEWRREFDEWVASHRDVQHFVDDSRESIYDDRGA